METDSAYSETERMNLLDDDFSIRTERKNTTKNSNKIHGGGNTISQCSPLAGSGPDD